LPELATAASELSAQH